MSELEEIKARADVATEGPWRVWDDKPAHRSAYVETSWSVDGENTEPITDWCTPKDAEFIAHARTDIPKLIAALEAVEATLLQVDEISGGTSADGDAYGRGIDRGLQIAVVTVRKTLTEALQ